MFVERNAISIGRVLVISHPVAQVAPGTNGTNRALGPCPNGPGPWGLVPMGPGALSQWAMGWSLIPMGRAPGLVPMGPGPGALSQWAMGWSQWALGLEPFAQIGPKWAHMGPK